MFHGLPEYEVLRTEEIEDIKSRGTLLRHKKSGARVLLLENNDENKVFNICFRTPPADSTGVAHILEHSVLCGSKKFPSKDPFVELAKGSLNTFLNAMTYPDKTMYPVASCNFQDFCNLMEVYMDAVLFPNIYSREEIFRQEGWSYILEDPEDALTVNGVVYNEMKGVFSSPDDILEREIMNSLFPDTPYGVESGGDPKVIPDLRYSDFLSFHSRWYHPSNCYIYLYGDLDMEERLSWLDREYLSKYDVLEIDSALPLQKPFEKPVRLQKKYPISEADDEQDKTYLAWSAVTGEAGDVNLSSAMAILEYVLLGAPGAPLKQALLDAGIGKDVDGSYEGGVLQPMFSVVAKCANPEDEERFVEVIRETLEALAKKGLEEKTILAGINDLEFKFREADYGRIPRGLVYGIDSFDSWLYDENEPFAYLKQLKVCEFLKTQVGTGYYENLIRTYLLENPHASVIVMKPEKGLTEKEDEALKEKLAAYKASLSKEEIGELVERTEKLRRFQETPSTKEELEAIPLLRLSDIEKKAAPIYNEELDADGVPVIYHKIDTNGIAHLHLLFDTKDLAEEDLPYLGLLQSVLGMVDTEHYGYRELSNEIHIHSGGITPTADAFADTEDPGRYSGKFGMRAKMLYEQTGFAFDMLEEILFTSDLSDEKRLREIVARLKSRLQTSLVSSGHGTAATRAMAVFSGVSAFNDKTGGIDFYELAEDLEEHFEEKKKEMVSRLGSLMKRLFVKGNLIVSVTAERKALDQILERISALREKLYEYPAEPQKLMQSGARHGNEGFETPSQVQYVAMAGNFCRAGYSYTGALRILKTIMGYEYLWSNIRVQGGAYGCMSGYGRNGDTYFTSYRDPNLERTVNVYEKIAEYVKDFTVDERDMCKYIIGAISELDAPLNPMAKGARSMTAYLCHISQQELQRERDEILNAGQQDIRALAPLLEAVLSQRHLCVIGNEAKIRAAKELFDVCRPLAG